MSSLLSVGGLATGIDTKTLVSQLMALERQPETLLTKSKAKMQSQIDVYTPLQTALSNLKSLMSGMNTDATFQAKTSSVSESTVISAQASNTAIAGTHDLTVTNLAKFQRQISANGFASSSALNFNTGSITIKGGASDVTVSISEGSNSLTGIVAAINASGANVSASIINDGSNSPYRLVLTSEDTNNYIVDMSGLTTAPASASTGATTYTNPLFNYYTSDTVNTSNWYSSASDLSFKTGTISINGVVDPIEINDANNSLNGIAAAINTATGNASAATVIQDGSGYRLQLINTISVDMSGLTVGTGAYANPTFSNIDPTHLIDGDATYSAGTNAKFILDGVSITKSSNTVTDAITGVTINLLKGGGSTSTLTIGNDNTAITKKINDFVSSYNEVLGIINKQSVYDAKKNTSAPLFGDSTLRTVKDSLRGILSNPVTGVTYENYSLLSQIGITTSSSDGTLSVNSSKLSSALGSNFTAVTDLFTHNGGVSGLTDRTKYGIAERFNLQLEKLTHAYIGSGSSENGIIATRISGLQKSMSNIDDQIERMELLLTQKEENLNKRFASMETMVSGLSTSGNALINSLSNMPKWS